MFIMMAGILRQMCRKEKKTMFNVYIEKADKYSSKIASVLSKKTVSKQRDVAFSPGGLVYEAKELEIDPWDLLEALEGMCLIGKAVVIDKFTYLIK